MRFSRLSYIFLIALFSSLLSVPVIAQEENNDTASLEQNPSETPQAKKDKNRIIWQSHDSVTGSYSSKFPSKYKYNIFPFQYNDTDVAFSAEIFADINEEDTDKNTEKSAFIRSVHTFGDEMSGNRAKKTLDIYATKYLNIAKALKGTLIKNEDIKQNGYLAKDIYLTYHEGDEAKAFKDKTAMRVRIYATNHAIIEQVITGPAVDMYSYRYDDFFESIKPIDGIGKSDDPIGTGWVSYASPNNVFTMKTPPINKDYTPHEPSSKVSKTRDRLSYEIKDPVVGESIYYHVTSYKLKTSPSNDFIQSLLIKNHLSKFVENLKSSNISMKVTKNSGITTYSTSIVVSPLRRLPYITKLSYSVDVKDNFVLVKEFFLGAQFYSSGIDKTFFDLTTFHPEKYKYSPPKAEPEADKK